MSRALENLQAGLTTIRPWMLVCSVVLAGGLLLALEAALARGLIWKLPVVFSMHPMLLRDGPDEWSIAAKGVRFPLASPAVKEPLAGIAPG